MDLIGALLNGTHPDTLAALTSPTVVEDAAKLLYCQFVNNRGMTWSEIQNMSDALGASDDYKSNPALAHQTLAAFVMEEALSQPDAFRANIAFFRAQSAGRTVPNFSNLSCTPVYESWNSVFDFTTSNGGFVATNGVWVAGEGWKTTNSSTVLIRKTNLAPVTFNLAEMIYSSTASSGDAARQTNIQTDVAVANFAHVAGSNLVRTWQPTTPVTAAWIQLRVYQGFNSVGTHTIHRFSIAGIGEKPSNYP
jgi:hypothetical protein